MNLETLGWSPDWARAFARVDRAGLRPGRVLARHRDAYEVGVEGGVVRASLPGSMVEPGGSGALPAVGDWVSLDEGRIRNVLPRRSAFLRGAPGPGLRSQVVAANVDHLFLVTAADGDFSPRRLERYLTLAWESGARPVVVVTKIDLVTEGGRLDTIRQTAEMVAPDVPVLLTSVVSGVGIDELLSDVGAGETVALLGSSGVGKSSLVNALLGEDRVRVAAVRDSDGRGRHTTTARQIHVLPGGCLLLDTPGLRELQMWVAEEGLERTFADIESLAAECRFRNCAHETEPGCAVRAAASDGRLDPARLESFHRLEREIAHLERRLDPEAAAEHRRREQEAARALYRQLREKGGA